MRQADLLDADKQASGRDPLTQKAIDLYFKDRLPIAKVAAIMGVSPTTIEWRIKRAGLKLRPARGGPKPSVPIEELERLYFAEELSTNDIAEMTGLHGETVRKRLRGAGHTLRGVVEARQQKAWRMSDADRKRTFGGATRNERRAKSREKGAARFKKTAPNELKMREMLTTRGLTELTSQRAVGIYNMDLATGTVGIEVVGGRHKPTNFASSAERIYFILKSGFNLIEVLHREPVDPLKDGAADEVIAFVERAQSLPPSVREYRMIGGSGQLLAVFKVNLDDLT